MISKLAVAQQATALKHLYVNLLGQCNLRCKMCYVPKLKDSLDVDLLLNFIERYRDVQELHSVTLCGGEVFIHPQTIKLINSLTAMGLLVIIITNGTIDLLDKLERPQLINLLVSLDGLPTYHDSNRGKGSFERSIKFIRHGLALAMSVEIFSIVTHENFVEIEQFEKYLYKELGENLPVTYHPRKPLTYLNNHPIDNILGQRAGFEFLSLEEYRQLRSHKKIFPPPELGCYQLSLGVDGRVFGCCEGRESLGSWQQDPKELIANFQKQLGKATASCQDGCLGCIEPDFCCGLKEYGVAC